MQPDRMRYIVVSGHRDGEYLPERDLADTDRATTVKDIQSGELLDVTAVIEFNIAEGIVADVTEDVLREAGKWQENQHPFTGQDLQDWLHDHQRDRRKAD
jgi:hypothetical protein